VKKLVIGCAVFLGVCLLLGLGAGFYVYRTFQSALGDREAHEAVEAQLSERDGPLAEQHPPLDGVPSPQDVAAYLRISRELAPRFERSGASMVDFLFSMNEKQNPLRRAVRGIRGSVDLTREISSLTARVDSLLLETGISEGNLAYVHALHRFGVMGWQPPSLEEAFADSVLDRSARREANEAVEGLELSLENGLSELLERQKAAIEALAQPAPEQAECRMWLEPLLEARSLFDALRHEGATERQRQAFAAVESELSLLVPTSIGAYFLEALTFGVDTDDGEGFSFNYSTNE
jgi:hypothetical protein